MHNAAHSLLFNYNAYETFKFNIFDNDLTTKFLKTYSAL